VIFSLTSSVVNVILYLVKELRSGIAEEENGNPREDKKMTELLKTINRRLDQINAKLVGAKNGMATPLINRQAQLINLKIRIEKRNKLIWN
jgi:hypothetical protein